MNDSTDNSTKLFQRIINSTEMSNRYDPDVTNPSTKTQLQLYDILIPSIGGFIILLNFLVVVSSGLILKKGQQPRSTYLFLGNVAMTDLITGVAVIFGQLYPKENRDHNICAVQLGMIVSSTLTSVLSVGLIAIDRFLYIIHGLQYQQWIYPTRARLFIAGTWVMGCIIGFMPLFGWYGDTDNGRTCWFILLAPKGLILLTVICGIVPILIVIVLYSIILYHAIKKIIHLKDPKPTKKLRLFRGKPISDSPDAESTSNPAPRPGLMAKIFAKKPSPALKSPSKWRAIKVVLFTTSSFVITWCPYFIASIIYVYKCENDGSKKCNNLSIIIASPLAILGFTNSLINPIIYAWWHKGFRNFVQRRVSTVIMKARRKKSSVSASKSSSATVTGTVNKSQQEITSL